jgi:hypothetical protein
MYAMLMCFSFSVESIERIGKVGKKYGGKNISKQESDERHKWNNDCQQEEQVIMHNKRGGKRSLLRVTKENYDESEIEFPSIVISFLV